MSYTEPLVSTEFRAFPLKEWRHGLLESYKAIVGGPAKSVYTHPTVMVDKRDFYRWLDGSLPASSQMTRRIDEFIQRALRQKRRL